MPDAPIPLTLPRVTGRERELVETVLRSGHWAGDGPMTRRACELLAAHTAGAPTLLTTSCTHALELAALLLDLGPGDEVIVPSFTFVSTASAFALRGARLVFVDIRPDTLCLDERLVEAALSPRTRAIVPVHYAGVPCAIDELCALASSCGATIIEDNAHGLFGRWRGRPLGSFGRMSALSFHQSKNISCGEGGALVLNDPGLVERAEILHEKGTDRARFFRGEVDKYTWRDLGSSYLPSELLAAVLVAQLEAAAEIQAARLRLWTRYAEALRPWAEARGVVLPTVPEGGEHPAHLFYVRMPDLAQRTALLAHLRARGIGATFHYQPLHQTDIARRLADAIGPLPVTEHVADTLVRIPLYPELSDHDQARVIDAVVSFALV